MVVIYSHGVRWGQDALKARRQALHGQLHFETMSAETCPPDASTTFLSASRPFSSLRQTMNSVQPRCASSCPQQRSHHDIQDSQVQGWYTCMH